jgi:DNA-binding NtrC family response regulator
VDALHVAEQHQGEIRLLVTDVIMPQMSGPDLAQRLKEARPEIQVLYMSGYTDDKLAGLSEPDSELALIQKPFYVTELAKKIRELLDLQPAIPPNPGGENHVKNTIGN